MTVVELNELYCLLASFHSLIRLLIIAEFVERNPIIFLFHSITITEMDSLLRGNFLNDTLMLSVTVIKTDLLKNGHIPGDSSFSFISGHFIIINIHGYQEYDDDGPARHESFACKFSEHTLLYK